MLIQFPGLRFNRTVIPFIASVEEAREVVLRLDRALAESPRTPLVFVTAASDEVRLELRRTHCPVIDFFDLHMRSVESILEAPAVRSPARLHGEIGRAPCRGRVCRYG